MIKRCAVCDKGPQYGHTLSRKGLAKKKGGTGKKTSRVNLKKFLPNLQKIRAKIRGSVRNIYICTKCLKKGKVEKII